MTVQARTEFVDFLLVSWRHIGSSELTAGMVHRGRLWPLDGVSGIEGDVLRACLRVQQDGSPERLAETVSAGPGESVSLDEVELGPPLSRPDKIICLGLNYTDHASEAGFEAPTVPIIFSKFRNSL